MTPSLFELVIFDLDGTLVDSLEDIADAMNRALASVGLPFHPLSSYHQMVGEGLEVLASRALPSDQQHLATEVIARYRAWYAEHFADRSAPYPGIGELLDALTRQGTLLAVLSNKNEEFTVQMVRVLLRRWRFARVRGRRPGVPFKPEPTAALEIARELGVAPGNCALVGDTHIDMETARAAGMFPVGVLWGFRDRTELLSSGAQALLAHPMELLPLRPGEP